MSRLLYRLGRVCVRARWLVLAGWIVLAAGLAVAAGAVGERTTENLTLPGSDSQRATDILDRDFPSAAATTAPMLVKATSGKLTGADNAKAVADTVTALGRVDHVTHVVSPLSQAGAEDLSASGTIGQIQVTLDVGLDAVTDAIAEDLDAALAPARDAGLQAAPGGIVGQVLSNPDVEFSELVGLSAAVVVLLVALGTAVAMITPIATAILGLATALSLVTLLEHAVEIPSVGPTLAIMIGLGVGIDYALFMLARHREGTARGLHPHEAAARATATTGTAIVFAGGTVIVALNSIVLAGLPGINGLGFAASVSVAVAVLAALTLMPAVLGLLGRRLESLRVPRLHRRAREPSDHRDTGWARWSRSVTGRPWLAVLVSLLILIPLAIPVLSLQLGTDDAGSLPESTPARQAYDLTAEGFGPGANGPLVVAATLGGGSAGAQADQQALQRLEQDIKADRGVASVSPPVLDQERTAAYLTVIPATRPQSERTSELVRRLRDTVIPKAERGSDVRASVGGVTAAWVDVADRIEAHLPLVIGAVIALSFLLLTLAFRSLAIPLKAALMNLLSVGASYGVLVAVFQWGWGAELIGLPGAVPITSFVPLMMFAILFGLSMDYEVFLMSQIRERHLAGEDTHDAVAHGLSASGRVITSAALIMVCVFASFLVVGNPTIKQFGLGMALAVAIDATIVRCLLVPSLMVLMRGANWWLPRWLDRVLPHVDVEGDAGLRRPESEPDSEPQPASVA